jgi:hypothetical protein
MRLGFLGPLAARWRAHVIFRKGPRMTSSAASMPLEHELDVYKAHLHEWTEHEGKYVVIHGDEIADFYGSYEDALKVGYEKFGLHPFLVKRVSTIEQVQFVSRAVLTRAV